MACGFARRSWLYQRSELSSTAVPHTMLLPRILSGNKVPLALFRPSLIPQIGRSRTVLHSIRNNTSVSSTTKFASKKPCTYDVANPTCLVLSNTFSHTVFPERLLIYHAGTGRSVFLGCLRITTIFIFAFFSLVVAPTHFFAEDEPIWVAPAGKFVFLVLRYLISMSEWRQPGGGFSLNRT